MVKTVEKSIENRRKKYFWQLKWPLRTAIKNYVEKFFLRPIWPLKNVAIKHQNIIKNCWNICRYSMLITFIHMHSTVDKGCIR